MRENSGVAVNGNGKLAPGEFGRADIETLIERASRPLPEAQALPASFYTDPAIYQLEIEKIFRSDWVYMGREEQVANPGDWLSANIGGEPVMLIRGDDGELRAMSRVCPHRFADILANTEADHGSCDHLVCPYHSWAFDFDGKLTGAPLMDESTRYARDKDEYRLRSFKHESWNGFVFVSLNPDVEPIAERLAEVNEIVAPYHLEDFRYVGRVDWPETEANWKLVMDNGRECYHHQGLHSESLEPLWPSRLVKMEETDSKFWFSQRLYTSPEAATGEQDGHLQQPRSFAPIEGLDPHQLSYTLLLGVYPNMFFSPGPDFLAVGRWFPTGPTTHVFEFGYAVHKDNLGSPDLDATLKQIHEWFYTIQAEDSRILTSMQQMFKSPNPPEGGALSHLERPVWQFQKYLAHRLGDPVS